MPTPTNNDIAPRQGEQFGQNQQLSSPYELTAEQRSRLQSRLYDIERADPLTHRRISISKFSDKTFHSISREDLRDIASLQDIFPDLIFSSHRKFLGPAIVLYKKLMFKFFRKWFRLMLGRQLELNQRLLNLAISVHVLESRLRHLEKFNQSEK